MTVTVELDGKLYDVEGEYIPPRAAHLTADPYYSTPLESAEIENIKIFNDNKECTLSNKDFISIYNLALDLCEE